MTEIKTINNDPNKVTDMPKIECPFVREENDEGDYVVIDEINGGYEWVFERDRVMAIEKLHGCFGYRTSIRTSEGLLPIGKIVNQKKDVKVLSYNFEDKTTEFNNITHYHKRKTNKDMIVVHVSLPYQGGNERSLLCTKDHKIYTDQGYKEASMVNEGDTVYAQAEHFSEILKQVTYGSVLGDGSIEIQDHSLPTLKFTHGEDQFEYLNWKVGLFGTLLGNIRNLGKGGYKGSKERKEVRIKTNPQLVKILKQHCIRNNQKTITQQLCDNLSPLGLAIWYLDDGTMLSKNSNQRSRVQFATNAFNDKECERLSDTLKHRFNLDNRVVDYGDGNRIEMTANASSRFWELVWMFIPKSMEYKLPETYRDTACCLNQNRPDDSSSLMEGKVKGITKPKDYEATSQMYDLTIDNHSNYFAGGVLVHNSNVSVVIEGGNITAVFNRKNRIPAFNSSKQWITKGILNSINRDYLNLKDGQWYGELVGPNVNGNPYDLDEHLWIPFQRYSWKHLEYKSWGKYPKNFDTISRWFKEDLIPLFYSKIHGVSFDEARENGFVEGIVFTDPETLEMAKVRRDMFSWYKGERH